MTDRFGKGVRSKIMASIRSRDTKPELKLKKAIRGLGFSYQPKIAGSPDFAHRKKKVAVFVHGCFWHNCPKHYRQPHSNELYWLNKIKNNALRDKNSYKILKHYGFKVLVFWEHDIKNMEKIVRRLKRLV